MSNEEKDHDDASEAAAIANNIQIVIANRSAVAGLAAIGMILGYYDAMRDESDMDIMRMTATVEAKRIRAERLQ